VCWPPGYCDRIVSIGAIGANPKAARIRLAKCQSLILPPALPASRNHSWKSAIHGYAKAQSTRFWLASISVTATDVRYGSKAGMTASQRDVRFAPESGHVRCS
jgi:hypothetical protein